MEFNMEKQTEKLRCLSPKKLETKQNKHIKLKRRKYTKLSFAPLGRSLEAND